MVAFVFFAFFILVISDTRVRKDEDDICSGFAHFWDDSLDGFDGVVNLDLAFKVGLIPVKNLRRDDPCYPDIDIDGTTVLVSIGLFDDLIWVVDKFTSLCIHNVGIDDWHTSGCDDLFKVV